MASEDIDRSQPVTKMQQYSLSCTGLQAPKVRPSQEFIGIVDSVLHARVATLRCTAPLPTSEHHAGLYPNPRFVGFKSLQLLVRTARFASRHSRSVATTSGAASSRNAFRSWSIAKATRADAVTCLAPALPLAHNRSKQKRACAIRFEIPP